MDGEEGGWPRGARLGDEGGGLLAGRPVCSRKESANSPFTPPLLFKRPLVFFNNGSSLSPRRLVVDGVLRFPVRPMAFGTKGRDAVEAGRERDALFDRPLPFIGGKPPLLSGLSLTTITLDLSPCEDRPSTLGSGPLVELDMPPVLGTNSCSPRL